MSTISKTEKAEIKTDDAVKMILNKEGILLDIRSPEEYNSGHIENSILLPPDKVSLYAEKTLKNKEALILLYCRTGRRSGLALDMLKALGYKNAYNLGGIDFWPHKLVK